MIRLATIEDKEELLKLAKYHIEHVGELAGGVELDTVNQLSDYVLTAPEGACFVYEKDNEILGFMAGIIGSPTLNTQQFFVEHLFVFKPGCGAYSVPIVKAVKKFVKDAELDGMIVAAMSTAGDRVFKLYDVLGMRELERKYIWTPKK